MPVEPAMPVPIADAAQVTPAWLTDRLRRGRHLPHGEVISVAAGEAFASNAAFLTPLTATYSADVPCSADVSCSADGNAPTHLILKVFRPGWFGGGVNEVVFYEDIAASMTHPAVPQCFDAVTAPAMQHCHLLLEDVSITHAPLPEELPKGSPSPGQLQRLTEELAAFHTFWWEHPRVNRGDFLRSHVGPLRMAQATDAEDIRAQCRGLANDLPRLLARFDTPLPAVWQQTYARAITAWADLWGERAQQDGLTLIHGDAHIWNVFFPKSLNESRPYLLDWETHKRGMGIYDLAYLLINLGAETRRPVEKEMLQRYHRGLTAGGVTGYDWARCRRDYRLAVLGCLFPPLFWGFMGSATDALTAFEDWNCTELLQRTALRRVRFGLTKSGLIKPTFAPVDQAPKPAWRRGQKPERSAGSRRTGEWPKGPPAAWT